LLEGEVVRPALIDTDIVSMFLRGHRNVVVRFEAYLSEYGTINFSIITYYEIVSGLKHRDAQRHLDIFLEFATYSTILPLTERSAMIPADIYADLRKQGQSIDDIDILIAGIAMANDLIVVTHNQRHFGRIEELGVEDWSSD
jgi:tRNA(fMet)-specific endonuclease VapC